MTLPDIDLRKIRLHKGSQDKAFEELCCQLASLEPRPTGAVHIRKGAGADAGVECFTRLASGEEIGWQVKYYSKADSSLFGSLDNSIDTALKKHPRLSTYIVCIPFDLSDARTARAKSPLQNWEERRRRWIKAAAHDGRRLKIELWGESQIKERLGRDDPAYSGRLLFWFDQEALTPAWFREKFKKACADLGQRYTPETNVELPIRRNLLAFARDPSLNDIVEKWTHKLQEVGRRTVNAVRDLARAVEAEPPLGLEDALARLVEQFDRAPIAAEAPIPVDDWQVALRAAETAASAGREWAWEQTRKKDGPWNSDPAGAARHYLAELRGELDDIQTDLRTPRWRLASARQMLVHGDAGQGKSHLLADAAAHQLDRSRPAIFLLGSNFVDGNPWQQILNGLDLPRHYQVKHFLGALDAAAQAADTRAVIFIDALNERHGVDIWPSRLAGMLAEIDPFPRVAVVLSCRTTYLDVVLPPALTEEVLPRLEHTGFTGSAARSYLEVRGFVLPGAPYLAPEFANPLLLRTCCDALEKEGQREFPKGLHGVSAIFGFYRRAVATVMNARLQLAPHRRIVERAIDTIARALAEGGHEYIAVEQAANMLDGIWPSDGTRERDLLSQLENEGVLTVEVVAQEDDTSAQEVRFTFQRFSDHAIATRWLGDHLDKSDPQASFAAGMPLHALVAGEQAYRNSGVVEAIAIQLPECTGLEILDAVQVTGCCWWLEHAFKESLLWRNQTSFTRRTLDLVHEIGGDALTVRMLIAITTEPENAFNANHLHAKLMGMSMPVRDQRWSTLIANEGEEEDHPVETLICWAWSNGFEAIEEARAELAAVTLTWFFTTTNRAVRDRATKALVALLAPRLTLAERLLTRFKDVDDPYVLERLLAGIYGAALQGLASDKDLGAATSAIYRTLFASGSPPVNVLIRDHGRCLVEYAHWRGCLPDDVVLAKARPPYSSPWPLEHVPDEVIDGFVEDYGRGNRFGDRIVSSTMEHGDFGIYIIPHEVNDWSPAPRDSHWLPTMKELHTAWHSDFGAVATPAMTVAYGNVLEAARVGGDEVSSHGTEARKAFEEWTCSLRVEGLDQNVMRLPA